MSNALRTMLVLSEHPELRAVDLGARLGLPKASTHRLLATLESFGFVERDAHRKTYRIGSALFDVALARRADERIVAAARRPLEDLARSAGETVHLIVLRAPDVVFLDGIEGSRGLRAAARIGERVPAYSTAAGKLLLAGLPRADVYRLYPNGLTPLARRTRRDPHALVGELRSVRHAGYAINVDEAVDGVSAIAVGVSDLAGRTVAAVTISVPTILFTPDRVAPLLEALRRTAREVSGLLARQGAVSDGGPPRPGVTAASSASRGGQPAPRAPGSRPNVEA